MSEGTKRLGGIRNAIRKWAKRLFHRSDKRRSNHSTSDQPFNETSHPPQDTSPLGTGANAEEQRYNSNWPLTTDSYQPSETLDTRTSSARGNQAGKKPSASAQDSRNETRGSQLADASASNNQPQSPGRNPQGAQQGYLKPALKRKAVAVNETPSQGPPQDPSQDSSHDYISESPYRYLSLEDSSIRGKRANAQNSDEQADGPIASGSNTNNYGAGEEHHEHYTDHTIHPRPAVVHEEITPHVHTIYKPTRTLSFHLHEHRTLIQPIVDPTAR